MTSVRQLAVTASRRAAFFYRSLVVPVSAFLPAPLAYGAACVSGDLRYLRDAAVREQVLRNLKEILGDRLAHKERQRASRDYFRHLGCQLVDELRLRGEAEAIRDLVEIRGLEHVEAALAAGKGALLCTGHVGSFAVGLALLAARGQSVTIVRRGVCGGDEWLKERFGGLFDMSRRYAMRPAINPLQDQFAVAAKVAKLLRKNELVATFLDAVPTEADLPRTVTVEFLGRQAQLLAGSVSIAQRTGSPVLVGLMRRSPDWRHQIFEISAPIAVEGDTTQVLRRCLAPIEQAVYGCPSLWFNWPITEDLATMNLVTLSGKQEKTRAPEAEPSTVSAVAPGGSAS
jgi:Kdo2-lipid IVA lauroyltransferase/acyltransferase